MARIPTDPPMTPADPSLREARVHLAAAYERAGHVAQAADVRTGNKLDWIREPVVIAAIAAALASRPSKTERVKALEAWLHEFVEGAGHTRVFLVSRQRMHPTGVDLWDEAMQAARSLLDTGSAEG